jgi:intracellular sulfur oxidation DsrE/DsrF family protein
MRRQPNRWIASAAFGMLLLAAAAAAEDASGRSEGEKGGDPTGSPEFVHPYLKDAGGIVRLTNAAEQPRKGLKVVLDYTTTEGLEHAARFANLYAASSYKPGEDLGLTLVLHGDATKAALSDEAYARHEKGAKNPHGELMRTLVDGGVEVLVCGQALAHKRYATSEVMPKLTVAASAATAIINKQLDGYAYMPFR